MLRKTGLFADAPVDQCYTVAYALEKAKCSRGTLLMSEGQTAPRLTLVVRGGVVVRSAGVAVAELGVGDYFGESGLLSATNLVKGAVESVSCVSTMATDLYVLEDYGCVPAPILKRLKRNWGVRASWRKDRVVKQRRPSATTRSRCRGAWSRRWSRGPLGFLRKAIDTLSAY